MHKINISFYGLEWTVATEVGVANHMPAFSEPIRGWAMLLDEIMLAVKIFRCIV
jgi:hypothetical protein